MENLSQKKYYHPVIFGNIIFIISMAIGFAYNFQLFLSNEYNWETIVYIAVFVFWLYTSIVTTITAKKSWIFLEENSLTIKSGKNWYSTTIEETSRPYSDIESVSILWKYSASTKLNSVHIKFKDEEKKRNVSGIKECEDLAKELKNKWVNVSRSDMKWTKWKEKEI